METNFIRIPKEIVMAKDISPRAILIYGILFNEMENGNSVSYGALAKELDTTAVTIRKCVKELVEKGFITVSRQGRNNVYDF